LSVLCTLFRTIHCTVCLYFAIVQYSILHCLPVLCTLLRTLHCTLFKTLHSTLCLYIAHCSELYIALCVFTLHILQYSSLHCLPVLCTLFSTLHCTVCLYFAHWSVLLIAQFACTYFAHCSIIFIALFVCTELWILFCTHHCTAFLLAHCSVFLIALWACTLHIFLYTTLHNLPELCKLVCTLHRTHFLPLRTLICTSHCTACFDSEYEYTEQYVHVKLFFAF
jgi:hypothetical protein